MTIAIGSKVKFNRTPVWKCVENHEIDLAGLTGTIEQLDEGGITIALDQRVPELEPYENKAHWGAEECFDHVLDLNDRWDYPGNWAAEKLVEAAYLGYLCGIICEATAPPTICDTDGHEWGPRTCVTCHVTEGE